MQKAGGIITLIAGIFAVIAALVTLMIGGVGAAVEADNGDTVLMLGWLGLFGSFSLIVFGALGISAKTKKIGLIIIAVSIFSAIAGGTLVAICMLLSLAGGILVTIGGGKEAKKSVVVVKEEATAD